MILCNLLKSQLLVEKRARAAAKAARYRAKNPKKYNAARRAAAKRYAKKYPGKIALKNAENGRSERGRNWYLLRMYGISLLEYNTMLVRQGGVCAGCLGPPTAYKVLCVDHDHETNKIRGLLCYHCNLALGYLKDSLETLGRLANYLKESK